MLGVRVHSVSDNNLGEPEQDANSALTELDKGLRSGKIGEQCESIVRFPKLFEKYPFPILINASFLKLADVFRVGSNFLRLCVLRVCQQSEKHLDKISNVDEFVRRVFSVSHSNDPIARAITLRTLGAVAGIIPERQQVHHSIQQSLDSHDTVEVEAAISAAMQFAAQSKMFAVSMCNKISDMIQGQATPADMKLQLIPILQYMHHDTTTAAMVRQLCTELLPSYPAQEFVLVTLKTLTQLAAATLVDIPSQVVLLLQYLRTDPRWEVKAQVLKNLHQLAGQGANLWPEGTVEAIVDVASSTEMEKILSMSLDVIEVLTKSPVTCHMHQNSDSKVRELCTSSAFSNNPVIAAKAIQVLTRILCHSYKEGLLPYGATEIIAALEGLILLLMYAENDTHAYQLKVCLHCAVSLCKVQKNYCSTFVDLLGDRVTSGNGTHVSTVCEALGAIGGMEPETLVSLRLDILTQLEKLSDIKYPTSEQTHAKIMLCTLIFQIMTFYEWTTEAEVIYNVVSKTNLWACFCIGREASRYGHHKISQKLFSSLPEQVSAESLHFWLVCLSEMSEAEAQLLKAGTSKLELVEKLNRSIVHYNKAIAALKAAGTPMPNFQFQAEYIRLRTEFLQCLVQLVHSCDGLCTVPPPAIASTIVQATRDDLQRHGYVTNQLRKCVKDFRNCGEMYWKLYQSAFDADPATLEHIQILQQICGIVEQSIEMVCTTGSKMQDDQADSVSSSDRLESRQLLAACRNAMMVSQVLAEDVKLQTITHRHVANLVKQVEIIANASLCFPRYFFQVLQSTSIKVAITHCHQPRMMGEYIVVQPGTQLAVKVEGVIQHGSHPGLFRTINGVVISVLSQIQSTAKGNSDIKPTSDGSTSLTQTVIPHRDFFTAQFLLAFPQGGQYSLVIDASVVDKEGNIWKTGPKTTLVVKVPD